MHVDQLRAFHAVAEHRSFSRAADSLHVTQPAISKRIRALEHRLGTALFDRIGRLVLLTEAGEKLLPNTRDILQRIADCETGIRNTSGHIDGTLAIATSHHVGLHRLPSVLRAFAATHPQVQLNLRFEDSEVAHELVRSGASELAVVTLDPQRGTTLAYLPLWNDKLRFVACRGHALTGRANTLADLCAHPAILPGFGTYTGRIIATALSDAGLQANVTMSTNYLETIRMLISIGLGWSALPETMIDASLQVIDVTNAPALTRELGCVLHPTRTLTNAARAFVHDITATAAH